MSSYFIVRQTCLARTTLNLVAYKILLEVIRRGNVGQIAEVGYVFCANLIAIALTAVWNFWVNLKLSWQVTQVK